MRSLLNHGYLGKRIDQRSSPLPPSAPWRLLNVPSPPSPPHVGRQLQSPPKWLTGVFRHPTGIQRIDGWMEWDWKVVYRSDASCLRSRGDATTRAEAPIPDSCWRKGRRATDDQEQEEENQKIWKRIESFSLSTNQRFELVECICNPISSERRWIIHIFRSQNNHASLSSTGLTSNRFDIDVSIVVHPCEKDSCNRSCRCFPQRTGGLRSTAQRWPFTRLPSQSLSRCLGGVKRVADPLKGLQAWSCMSEVEPVRSPGPRARTRIPSHTQWRLTFFDVKRTRTCEVGVWPAGWGGMAAMSEM